MIEKHLELQSRPTESQHQTEEAIDKVVEDQGKGKVEEDKTEEDKTAEGEGEIFEGEVDKMA